MITTNAYLNFDGTCEEAMNFYATLLGGKLVAMVTARGTSMEAHCPPELLDQIMHARMLLGSNMLMASDVPAKNCQQQTTRLFDQCRCRDACRVRTRIYAALSEGGSQTMPITETFWAHRFGTCTDRFGTPWMVNCEKPMES